MYQLIILLPFEISYFRMMEGISVVPISYKQLSTNNIFGATEAEKICQENPDENFKLVDATYIPNDNPNESFKVTMTRDTPDVQTWTFRPSDTSSGMLMNKTKMEYLNKILNILPKLELPINKDILCDYPIINSDALNCCGYDYHNKRPVFVVGQVAFFRRYNDDWSGCIVYGYNGFNDKISWQTSITLEALTLIYELISTKKMEEITQEEIMTIVRS